MGKNLIILNIYLKLFNKTPYKYYNCMKYCLYIIILQTAQQQDLDILESPEFFYRYYA